MRQALIRHLASPSGPIGRFVLAPVWNRRNAALNDAALGALALRPADRVLEVGFGGGYLLARMADALPDGWLAGADASPEMVAYCARRFRRLVAAGRLDLRCAPADALPFPDAHVTKLVSVNSLFYWPSIPRALAEFRRVLAGGGRLVLCFTEARFIESSSYLRGGVRAYALSDVQAMLGAAGFGDVQAVPGRDRHRAFWCVIAAGDL